MARQICISTDIGVDNMTVNYDDLTDVVGLNLFYLDDNPVLQINTEKLGPLEVKVRSIIDELFLNRKETEVKLNKDIDYKWGQKVIDPSTYQYYEQAKKLNLRKSYDWHIAVLISLLELIIAAIKCKGSLFIFDRTPLEKYQSVSIKGFLHNNRAKGQEGIKNGLIELYKSLDLEFSIDDVTLQLGLENLQQLGLIVYDDEENEYFLTARGRMWW